VREFAVPAVATVGDGENLTDPVWDNAEKHPHTVQFVNGTEKITSRQFRDRVITLAGGLIAAGITAGDRVALMSRTRYEWTLIDFAIWTAGGVTVPIYETSSPEQVEWILSDSGAVACFVEGPERRADVAGVRERTPALKSLWQIEPPADAGPSDLANLIDAGSKVSVEDVEARRRSVTAKDLATIIYTSGTTGRPKGCMITHRNLAADYKNAVPGLPDLFVEGASTLLFMPLAHSFARLIQCGLVYGRVSIAFAPNTATLAEDLTVVRPTFVLAVPRVFEKVYNAARQKAEGEGKGAIFNYAERIAIEYSEALDRPGGPGWWLRARHAIFDKLVYSRIRAAMGGELTGSISGGAPLNPRLVHFFRSVGLTVYEGYGLTETSPAVAVNLLAHRRVGTVGRPLPGVTVRVDDDGEILVKGDIVFPGYWNNAAATAAILDADGWLRTGDLGALDDDGFLTITGRKKELIITAAGKNVAPAVLEDRVRQSPIVSQCMVVGDRMPFVAALITLDDEALRGWLRAHDRPADGPLEQLREDPAVLRAVQAAIDEANQAVSKAESIRKYRILPGDFTETNGMLTPSLKVRRTVVTKEYADEIAAIYS
jgi:long-chain acyl-CoA synthetase